MAIRVGIIDSGLNTGGIPAGKIVDAVCIKKNADGVLEFAPDEIADSWGHGTTCFSIIDAVHPGLEYVIVKIFQGSQLSSDSLVLAGAIEYCIRRNVHIINMSLGIETNCMPDVLTKACNRACEKEVIMVAAAHNNSRRCYPAYYPPVIGVGTHYAGDEQLIYHQPGAPIPFYASGASQAGELQVTSFSCARVTGLIAAIFAKAGPLPLPNLLSELNRQTIPLPQSLQSAVRTGNTETLEEISEAGLRYAAEKYLLRAHKFKGVHKVLLAACTPGTNLFSKIPVTWLNNGFEVIGTGQPGPELLSTGWMEEQGAAIAYDTVAAGFLEHLMNSPYRKTIGAHLRQFVEKGKQFIFFDEGSRNVIRQLQEETGSRNHFFYTETDAEACRELMRFRHLPSVKTPVIALLGAGHRDTTYLQVFLKKILEKNQYAVSYIATSRHAALAEADYTYAYTDESTGRLLAEEKIYFLHHLLKGVQYFLKPDFIVTGTCTKLVPHGYDAYWPEAATFLYGVRPDALVIYADHSVSEELLEDAIDNAITITHAPVMAVLTAPGKELSPDFRNRMKEAVSGSVIAMGQPDTEQHILEAITAGFNIKQEAIKQSANA